MDLALTREGYPVQNENFLLLAKILDHDTLYTVMFKSEVIYNIAQDTTTFIT